MTNNSENNKYIYLDGRKVTYGDERNVLEVARKAGIDIPTFCYHSELSVYGACRLCLVDIDGRGIVTSCSTVPEPGLKIKTNTKEIRNIRKINVELLLANHERECTSCGKSGNCSLQTVARKLGIDRIRYKTTRKDAPIDKSSPCLEHNPNKCVLCGDCVRFCDEIQSVGAIDFAHRGPNAAVKPAFGKQLADVECVGCGQCSRVCPTGALIPRSELEEVWNKLDDPKKTVVVQVAPAIRTALGEHFGMAPGTITTGRIVAALKAIGFDKVFDTSFTADLTVIEETNEFIQRFTNGENLPQFTSCCPSWVKFAEQYYPELLANISSCRSPQQMFGSLAKEMLPKLMEFDAKDLTVVSIMPCTAKKFEAKRPEFNKEAYGPDVDHVITTQELARMIEEAGIDFHRLQPEAFNLPMGFNTGAGAIFGASGGVTEAVLRYAVEKVNGVKLESPDFYEARGKEGIREVEVELAGKKVKMAIVFGLANARKICETVRAGQSDYQLIEVMACPGGCINGAGQPATYDYSVIQKRGQSLYQVDKQLQIHKAQDNPYIAETYNDILEGIGSKKAHHLLHTTYCNRKRISDEGMELVVGSEENAVTIGVCMGTNCYLNGSQNILKGLMKYVESNNLQEKVKVNAAFCFENCGQSPNVRVGKHLISACTLEKAQQTLAQELNTI